MIKNTSSGNAGHYEVLILGAGISGLGCASKLYNHEYFKNPGKILVIEGRDRIGGRIESVVVNGNRLDTGANWIHGVGSNEAPNPLMELVAKKRCRPLSGTVAFKASIKGNADAQDQVIPSQISGTIISGLWGTIGSLHEMSSKLSPEQGKQTTICHAIIETEPFQQTYKDLPQGYHSTFGSILQFIENMEAGSLTERSIERQEGEPTMSILEYAIDDFEGDHVFVQDGYREVVNDLAKDFLDGGLVKLDTEVKHIDWSSNPIRIQTDHGEYTANNVVCTLPLGILKDQRSAIFEPSLPFDKEEAIQKLGYGTLNKIFLVYESPWWNEDPFLSIIKKGVIGTPSDVEFEIPDNFMGFTHELPGIEIHQDGATSSGPYSISTVNLYNLTGFPVLSSFVSCSTAVQIETMTNEKAGDIIHRSLNTWFGQPTPKPTAAHVTRWSQDRFSKGSYSHMIAGLSENAHREVFQKPITNSQGAVLRFAGEHTSSNRKLSHFDITLLRNIDFATVHGALISGRREADSILKHIDGAKY